MLSDIQQQAIVECLYRLDGHTQRNHPWPRPPGHDTGDVTV